LPKEVGTTVDVLAARLGGAVTNDESTGIRVMTAAVARKTIDDHRDAVRAQREATAQRAASRQPHPTRERLRALRAAQEAAGLRVNGPIQPGAALEAMKYTDGSRERQLDDAAEQHAEMVSGGLRYRPIRERRN
jgi:hypothetical protein